MGQVSFTAGMEPKPGGRRRAPRPRPDWNSIGALLALLGYSALCVYYCYLVLTGELR